MDLVIAPGPGVADGMVIPSGVLVERFSRSPGPGGQSVNTTDSRVELALDVAAYEGFTDAQRRRLLGRLEARLVEGHLVGVAHEHRSQHRNRAAARERMAEVLREALAPPPPPRRATKPTRGSVRRRLETKRLRAQTKIERRRPDDAS